MLISSFLEEEVKATTWEFDGDKCSSLDGYNFNFIKAFWEFFEGGCP